ncbi:hypothetical protein OIV83_004858 [Microbotryomycetes sp. JL201]|nr:hypothetical protein OIV83_004858 [Microbotryomycetes sp. JL201]
MSTPGPSQADCLNGLEASDPTSDIVVAGHALDAVNGSATGATDADADAQESKSADAGDEVKQPAPLTLEQQAELENAFLHEPIKDEDDEVLLTTIDASITSCSSFPGRKNIKPDSTLALRRDKYSVQAYTTEVRIDSDKGPKIGLLSKNAAKGLAPLIDSDLVDVQPRLETLPANAALIDEIPIKLSLYGTKAIGLDKRMDFAFPAREKLKQAAEESAKKAVAAKMVRSPSEVDQGQQEKDAKLISASLKQDTIVTGRRSDVLAELFKAGSVDPARLPMHPCPPGRKDDTMRTDLLPFQRQGLAWMIRMEHPQLPKTPEDPPVQLWQMKRDAEDEMFWFNIATQQTQREKPKLRRGGILADEMGKTALTFTMQTIALICTDDTGEGVISKPEDPDDRYDDMTLIVCPLSVLSNWDTQLRTHVGSKRMQWHIYHGEGRSLSKKQLRQFDVVITTYQAVASEIAGSGRGSRAASGESEAKKMKRDDTLHHISWRRVVLDEGHIIKNRASQMYQGCISLKAERKWILTGTPIVNSAGDLGAMVTFTRLCRPLDEPSVWKALVGDGKRTPDNVSEILRAVVSSTTLRRTKDMTDLDGKPLVKLPSVKFFKHKVQLKPEARKLYDEVEAMSKVLVETIVAEQGGGNRYTALLLMVLRLRQLACNPSLCPESYIEAVRSLKIGRKIGEICDGLNTSEIAEDVKGALRRAIAEGRACQKCQNMPDEACSTFCQHIFCFTCIKEAIDKYSCCPECRMAISSTEEIVMAGTSSDGASEVETTEEAEVMEQQKQQGVKIESAKTDELIRLLKLSEPGVKSLVFSQWVTHLNCIEPALEKAGIKTCRFQGSMTQAKRAELIKSFQVPIQVGKKYKKGQEPPTVMLISLKAGALGLNLTTASQVFLMDPWWQASIEQQAIDRVYRIGQEREVRVFQMIAENTVEDKVLATQDRKDKLIAQAFSGNKQGNSTSAKIESKMDDILELLSIK